MKNKFKSLHLPLLFCWLALTIASCKKPKEEPPLVRLIPQEVKDYCYFLPGTYWIYEDSISGAQDSVWVWDAYGSIDTLAKDNPYGVDAGIYEWFKVKTSSSFFNADYFYWSNAQAMPFNKFHKLTREIISQNVITEGLCFFYPFETGITLYNNQNNETTFLNALAQFNNFKTVSLFNESYNPLENNSQTHFYFANRIGIIRKEIYKQNQVWNLTKYVIIQ